MKRGRQHAAPSETSRPRGHTAEAAKPSRRPAIIVPAIVIAVLTLIGVIWYTGSSALLSIVTATYSAMFLSAWLLASLGWGAHLTRWIGRGLPASRLTWFVTTLATGWGVLGLLTLLLGLAGAVGTTAGWCKIAGGLVLGAIFIAKHRDLLQRPKPAADDNGGSRSWRWLWLAAVPVFAVVVVAALVPPGLLWKPAEPHGFDVVEYHFQAPREWLEAGQIVPLRHNAFSFFPFAVEMHYLLAMELQGGAWAGAFTAQFMHVAMTAAAILAVYAIARQVGGGRGIATVAAFAVATVPVVVQLAPIGFNEGGLLLYGTLALGWLLIASADASRRAFALAGVMAGFACGVKLTGGPLVLAALPAALILTCNLRMARQALVGSALYVAIGLVVFSPWPIRNMCWTGNPVFPEASAVFGSGHFTPDQVQRWKAAHSPPPKQQGIVPRLEAFVDQVTLIPSLEAGDSGKPVLPVRMPLVLVPLGLTAMLLSWRRTESRLLLAVLLIHVVFWVGFTHLQGRFFVPALPVLAIALALPKLSGRAAMVPVGLGGLYVAVAWVGWWPLSYHLNYLLHEQEGVGLVGVNRLAYDDFAWISDVRTRPDPARPEFRFPVENPQATLVLIGDAEAFYYPVPMSQLRYRTPFDVKVGRYGEVLSGYEADGGKSWLLIAPGELKRFYETYQPFPRLSEELTAGQVGKHVLVPPTAVPAQRPR